MTNDATEKLVEDIESLIIDSEEFQGVEKELKYFCPFEAIGMVDQEIRHAHFLSYVLDPNRPHEFGDAYLRALLHIAAKKSDERMWLRPIDIHLMDLGRAFISREQDRIDLRIELPDEPRSTGTVLIFELKINSKESKEQLRNYRKRMQEQYEKWRIAFFFLTLTGEDPREENRSDWIPLSLKEVLSQFEKTSQRSVGEEQARKMMDAYIAMMRRKHVGDDNDRLQDLAAKLWSEHKEALEFLVAAQPDDVSVILEELYSKRDDVCKHLSDYIGSTFHLVRNSKPAVIQLYPGEFDHINKEEDGSRILVLVINRHHKKRDHIWLRWMLEHGSWERREAIYNKISGKKSKLTPIWTQIMGSTIDIGKEKDYNMIKKALGVFAKKGIERMAALRPD